MSPTCTRWLKAWRVNLESEAKERTLAMELVGQSENVAFSFLIDGGPEEEIKKAPMAYVPDLVGKVNQLLEQSDR